MAFSFSFRVDKKAMAPWLALLLILGLLVSACGGSSSSSGSSKSSVLTIVPSPIGDFTRNFSPFSPTASYGTPGMIFETLLYFNKLDGSVKPWLASNYKVADDAKSVTFTIRQNVKWSDGKPFSADDVVFTLNLLKQYPAIDTNSLWKVLDSVSAPDDKTVSVTFKKSYSPILWYLAGQTYIVPKHIWSSVGDPTKYANPDPVGTGPYMLKSFTPQLIALKKNPNFWQPGKPEVQEIHYPSFNSATSTSLVLSRGELDWSGLYTPDIQQTYVNRDTAHNKYWFPPSNIVMLYLNTAKAPFNQLEVRKAISSAIDREQIFKVAENGYEPVAHPTGLVLPANKSFMNKDYESNSFSLDTATSTQLLEKAGFSKGGDGIYQKNGQKISFNINVVTGWTDWVTACQIMADNLKKIGMDVKVSSIAYNAYYTALQTGSYDAAISWTNPGPTPYYLYKSLLSSENTAPLGQSAASNFERWSNPATDKLLEQYATSADKTVQQQALDGIQKIMAEQLPAIPLVYGATWYEYSTKRFTGWPDEQNPYAVPAPWSYPDNEMVILNLKPVA